MTELTQLDIQIIDRIAHRLGTDYAEFVERTIRDPHQGDWTDALDIGFNVTPNDVRQNIRRGQWSTGEVVDDIERYLLDHRQEYDLPRPEVRLGQDIDYAVVE